MPPSGMCPWLHKATAAVQLAERQRPVESRYMCMYMCMNEGDDVVEEVGDVAADLRSRLALGRA